MNELESKLQTLIQKFDQSQSRNLEMENELSRKHVEIEKLRKTVDQQRNDLVGDPRERHRLRYLEQQKKEFKKSLEHLLTKISDLEEKLKNGSEPL